jgi:hypothetical protein
MLKRLAFALLCLLALCAGDWSAVDAAQPLPSEVEAEPVVPLESFTSESGWLARWQADHQRRAAKDGWIQTDRPSFTLSDSTVPKGWIQLESGYLYSYAHEHTPGSRGLPSYDGTLNTHTLPELNLRWGLTNWAELRVSWGGVRMQYQRYESYWGIDDYFDSVIDNLEIGAKFQVTQQNGWIPKSALVASVILPTGSDYYFLGNRLFYNDQVMPAIDYVYTWSVTERFSIGGSSGAVIGDVDEFAARNYFQSVIGRFHYSPALSLFCEFYGSLDRRYRFTYDTYDWHPFFDTGIQWRPLANLQFDWRIGLPLGGEYQMNGLFTGVGVSARY